MVPPQIIGRAEVEQQAAIKSSELKIWTPAHASSFDEFWLKKGGASTTTKTPRKNRAPQMNADGRW